MGRREHQMSGGGDAATLVEEIEQTGDRLAAAVEALAFKKAHLKDEVIEIAEEKADHFLEKFARETIPVLEKFMPKSDSERTVMDEAIDKAKETQEQAKDALKAVPKTEKKRKE